MRMAARAYCGANVSSEGESDRLKVRAMVGCGIHRWLERLTGGAIRHCDAAMLKPSPSRKMMGKKTEMDVVTVMMKLIDMD